MPNDREITRSTRGLKARAPYDFELKAVLTLPTRIGRHSRLTYFLVPRARADIYRFHWAQFCTILFATRVIPHHEDATKDPRNEISARRNAIIILPLSRKEILISHALSATRRNEYTLFFSADSFFSFPFMSTFCHNVEVYSDRVYSRGNTTRCYAIYERTITIPRGSAKYSAPRSRYPLCTRVQSDCTSRSRLRR